MFYSKTLPLFLVVLIFGCATVPVPTRTVENSVLVGSLKGTLHKPPRSFLGNSPSIGGERGSVEVRGFRLIRKDNGKTFYIRPLRDSFFQQKLPPGMYELVRVRTDRPSYKEDKEIDILTVTVPENSLVNLGTIEIILERQPDEVLAHSIFGPTGKYTYYYRYERVTGADAIKAPLKWFFEKDADASALYTGRIVEVTSSPTDTIDSSRFILKKFKTRYFFR